MLKFQIALATLLICSIAFVSCGRVQDLLEPPADDTPTEMVMEMMAAHKSWDHVMLPAPTMTIPEAAAAMNPGGTGQAHGVGTRTVYFNEVGAMANRAGTAYPAGTMIVKEAMDVTETFVKEVVTMMKVDTDDPMYAAYAAYNGWVYGATQRASETDELMMPQTVPMAVAANCHGCHAKASKTTTVTTTVTTDSVFVSLPPAAMTAVVTDPVVTDPVVTDPVVTDPTDPVVTDPVVTDPVVTDPVVTDPVVTDPVVTDPVVTDPVVTDPVDTDPVVTDPVVTDPVVTDPVVTDPVVTDPVVTDPVDTDPVDTQ